MEEEIIGRLCELTGAQLERLEDELWREQQRRASSAGDGGQDASHIQEGTVPPDTEVLEYRPKEDGYLQLELRRYIRRDGSVRERGPYWYFQFHEGGKRKKLYLVVRQPFTLLRSISTSEWAKCPPHAYLKGLTAKL